MSLLSKLFNIAGVTPKPASKVADPVKWVLRPRLALDHMRDGIATPSDYGQVYACLHIGLDLQKLRGVNGTPELRQAIKEINRLFDVASAANKIMKISAPSVYILHRGLVEVENVMAISYEAEIGVVAGDRFSERQRTRSEKAHSPA